MSEKSRFTLKSLIRYALQGAALGVLATVGVFFFTIDPGTVDQLHSFSWEYIPLLFGLIACSWFCSGMRIRLLCESLGYNLSRRQAMAVILSSEFGMAASPGGTGAPVILLSFLRKAGLPLTTATSVLAADLGADIAFFAIFIPVAFLILLNGPEYNDFIEMLRLPLFIVLGILFAAVIFLLFVFHNREWMRRIFHLLNAGEFGRKHRLAVRFRYLKWNMRQSYRRIMDNVTYFYRCRRDLFAANFALACIQWFARYSVLPIILMAFSGARNGWPLVLVQAFLFGASLLLIVPGGGGSVEVVMSLLLGHFVPLSMVGVTLVLWRFFTYHLYLIVGGTVFFIICKDNNPILPGRVSNGPDG